nr:arginase family protein [Mesorhizobium loti]
MSLSAPLRPFLDWAVNTNWEQWDEVQASVLGIPYSEHYSGEPRPNDQALAPEAIRGQSGQFCDGPLHWDFDIGGPLRTFLPDGGRDCGNLNLGDQSFDDYFSAAVAILKRQFASSKFSAILGGDHGATVPVVHALEAIGRPVHLVQIDAHIDWRDEVGGIRRGYSSPVRRASELPWISGITQIGIRGTGSARAPEVEAAREWGARIVPAREIHEEGLSPILRHLAGKGPFYLTVDADGLDPSVMPAVLGPVPGGLRVEQVQPIIRALAKERLVGMDVVEVAPGVDLPNQITSITAGRLMVNALVAALQSQNN